MRTGLALVAWVALVGCGAPSVGPRSTKSIGEAASARQACTFKAGTLPGLSLAKDARIGVQLPIDTIVVIMMENRSTDHLLGNFKAMQPDADIAPLDATNPDTNGTPIQRYHMDEYCFDDPNHGWNEVHGEWNNGAMDGFVKFNYQNNGAPADGRRAMGYYTEADIPFIYALASTFSFADRSFCSLLGPTFPNRAYMQAGTSYGLVGGTLFKDAMLNVIDILEGGKVTWHDYYAKLPTLATFFSSFAPFIDNALPMATFFDDAAAGKLAQVNWVDPELGDDFGAVRDDFHPPGVVQLGDQYLEKTIKALMASPQWPHMAIIVTFDEHGGLYDHVPPPPACPPDGIEPVIGAGDTAGHFDRLGVRVPTIVISPYAKPHHVSHDVYDHTSILRFIESRFGLPAMTARDANADPFYDMFDFDHPALLQPPSLPTVVIDEAKKDACNTRYPPP